MDITTQSFIMNSEELIKEISLIRIDQLGYTELTATPQEIDELENLRNIIENGLNDGDSYDPSFKETTKIDMRSLKTIPLSKSIAGDVC